MSVFLADATQHYASCWSLLVLHMQADEVWKLIPVLTKGIKSHTWAFCGEAELLHPDPHFLQLPSH